MRLNNWVRGLLLGTGIFFVFVLVGFIFLKVIWIEKLSSFLIYSLKLKLIFDEYYIVIYEKNII